MNENLAGESVPLSDSQKNPIINKTKHYCKGSAEKVQ